MKLLHSLFGFAGHLGLSRARRDGTLLFTAIAVLAVTVVLAVAMPRLVLAAVDTGASQAVAEAGHQADIEITMQVGTPRPQSPLVAADTVVSLADEIPGRLPAVLARLYPELYLTILSTTATVRQVGVQGGPRISLQLGMLPTDAEALTLTAGSLPSAQRDGERGEIDVVLSAQAAEAASISIGDELEFASGPKDDVVFVVSGFAEPADEQSPLWEDLPTLWSPTENGAGSVVGMTALTNVAGITAAEGLFDNLVATLRLAPDATRFTSESIVPVTKQIAVLRLDSSSLAGDSGAAELVVRSSFDTALEGYPARARAAMAQMLVLVAGVLGVAAAVVMLLTRLVVLRRAAELALERARGASLAAIVTRSVIESMLVTAAAGAIGIGVSIAVFGAGLPSASAIAFILAVGVLAAPVQAAILIVVADRSTRRVAANRGDRHEKRRRGAARRLVLEGFIVVVAAAALFAVRSRGLLQTRTDGVDPLLAAAPLLMAIAVTVIVLRIYPFAVRGAMALGRRTRGALGTLCAMQAERAIAVLPLAALTLAISLVVSGGLLVDTVRSGQVHASWQRTGADVRVDGPITESQVAAVAAADGVTAATGLLTVRQTRVAVGAETALVTLLAIDPSAQDVLAELPPESLAVGGDDLSVLFEPVSEADPVPILVDESLARKLQDVVTLTVAGETRETLDARVVGTFDAGVDGYDRGPYVYISRAALISHIDFSVELNRLLATGDGAEVAAQQLDGTVFTRTQWLKDRQQQALVSGVNTVMLASTAAVGLLALIGLVASVLAGSRARRRSLSLLRTLGLSSRFGWWLALSELAPLVIAAVIGGVVAGVGVVLVLAPSFGLESLAGGVSPPALSIAPWVILGVAGAAIVLALVAMVVEVLAHRRDRLSEVLRVGESL
jgi:putative ABC transport system permease protein